MFIVQLAQAMKLLKLHRHSLDISASAVSQDGRHIATGSTDQTIVIWDADTGEPIYRLPGHQRGVHGLDYSKDGKFLVSAGNGSLVVWALNSNEAPTELRRFSGFPQPIQYIKLSPDGTKIVALTQLKTVEIWSVETDMKLHSFYCKSCVYLAVWSWDSQLVAIGGEGRVVSVLDTKTAKLWRRWEHKDDGTVCIAFEAEDSILVGVTSGSKIKIWVLREQGEATLKHTLGANMCSLLGASFSPLNMYVACGCFDHAIRIFDIAKGTQVGVLKSHFLMIKNLVWSPGSNFLVSVGVETIVRLWRPEMQVLSLGMLLSQSQSQSPLFIDALTKKAHAANLTFAQASVCKGNCVAVWPCFLCTETITRLVWCRYVYLLWTDFLCFRPPNHV